MPSRRRIVAKRGVKNRKRRYDHAMATRRAAKKGQEATPKKRPARRTPRKQKADSAGLEPLACSLEPASGEIAAVKEAVLGAGGLVVGQYRDPLGGHALVLAVLPAQAIEPT